VELQTDFPATDLPKVIVDEDRLEQVLLNLVGNALQYTLSGGNVQINLQRENDEVRVIISDTGIGILAEHLPHIFSRFYRVDPSRARVGGGSGIGLTISKHLVEAHGGRIWAESPGLDQGSTFIFTLPIIEATSSRL
jgi:histidine kinase